MSIRTFASASLAVAALAASSTAHAQLVDWRTMAVRSAEFGARGRPLEGFVPAVGTYEKGGECAVTTSVDDSRTIMRAYPSFGAARHLVLVHLNGRTPVAVSEFRFERGVALPSVDTDALLEATNGDSVRSMRHMRLYVALSANGRGIAENDYLVMPENLIPRPLTTSEIPAVRRVTGPRELFDGSTRLGNATARAQRVVEACDVAADAR